MIVDQGLDALVEIILYEAVLSPKFDNSRQTGHAIRSRVNIFKRIRKDTNRTERV